MATGGRLVAGSRNRNEFVVINADDSGRSKAAQYSKGEICLICGDEIEILEEEKELFVACNECAFPVCRICYEYERREGTQACPQCRTRYKRHKDKLEQSPLASKDRDHLSFSGLEHCNPAWVRSSSSSILVKGQELSFPRSKIDKKGNTKYDLKLDRLSDNEKKKIIENLVKFQNDGTVEVDVARSAPVASELLELGAVDAEPTDMENTIFEFSKSVPKLKIAMLVDGTRGDVQPFIAFAKRLQTCIPKSSMILHYMDASNFCLPS